MRPDKYGRFFYSNLERMFKMIRTSQKKYSKSRGSFGLSRIIATVFGLIELILAFRFILKLLGANENNGLVQGLYVITHPIVGVFEGIFSTINTNIAEIHGVFEPATIIAVVVIGFIEWALLRLISKRSASGLSRVA